MSKKKNSNSLQEIFESYIDRIISMQDDRQLNVFDSGIMVDLKALQRVTYKKILKIVLKKRKIYSKKNNNKGGK
jgi:hypothetical protein